MNRRLLKFFSILIIVILISALTSCGKVASQRDIVSYAKEKYGKCELIREEHSGSDTDEIRTLYLKDLETGIEYSITSKMVGQGLDGAIFGYSEQKQSDFEEKYSDYVYNQAEQDITSLETGHPAQILLEKEGNTSKVIFDHRTSDEDALKVCRSISEIIAQYDTKDFLVNDFLVYCENEDICIGFYADSSDSFTSYEPYVVLDYVYEHVDKDADFRFSLGGYIGAYLHPEDIDQLGLTVSDDNGNGTFFFFTASSGELFVAFNMEDFGKEGIYCVSEDTREEFLLQDKSS